MRSFTDALSRRGSTTSALSTAADVVKPFRREGLVILPGGGGGGSGGDGTRTPTSTMGTPVTGAGGASAAPGTSSKVTVSMRPVYGVDGVTPFVGRPLSIGMLRSSPFERSLEKLRVFWQEKDFVRFAAPKVRVCLSWMVKFGSNPHFICSAGSRVTPVRSPSCCCTAGSGGNSSV
jgi:hypothetical protein